MKLDKETYFVQIRAQTMTNGTTLPKVHVKTEVDANLRPEMKAQGKLLIKKTIPPVTIQ